MTAPPQRLLQITVDVAGLEWMDRGRCAETDPDAFFPEKGQPAGPAKSICASCDVRDECLNYALDNRIDWGIWGGFSAHQRRGMRAPRKSAAA